MELNLCYEVEANAPGFLGFGSSGGGEMLALDARGSKPWKVVMIPFIPMQAEDAIVIAADFRVFLQSMGQKFGG